MNGNVEAGYDGLHYDEEDCLGLELFAAELELTLASSRDGRGDQTQLLELLQKLQASIGGAPPAPTPPAFEPPSPCASVLACLAPMDGLEPSHALMAAWAVSIPPPCDLAEAFTFASNTSTG